MEGAGYSAVEGEREVDNTSLSGALELPTYADSVRPVSRPGFANPQYSVERGGCETGEVGEEGWRESGDTDDLPPPYSPGGFVGSQREVYVAPPEYFAIFGQIREAREESTNHFVFLRKLLQILLNTIGCTVILLVFMSVPITVFGLGVYFLGDCPTEPNIPIFLVVGGVSGALKNVALIFENIIKRTSHRMSIEFTHKLRHTKYIWRAINLVFDLFLVAWILAGSYWIYHIYNEVNPQYDGCNETLYKFAFGVITSSYILFAMTCCCMCVCSICLLPRQPGENEGGGEDGEPGEGVRGDSHSPTPHSDTETSTAQAGEAVSHQIASSENGEIFAEPVVGRERELSLVSEQDIAGSGTLNHHHPLADGGDGERTLQQFNQGLSLDDLEPLDIPEYHQTPVLSPRSVGQLRTVNEQGQLLSPRTTSV